MQPTTPKATLADTQPLPDVIALFPLPGAIMLPGCKLPLNIFEPRYLTMINDAEKALKDGKRAIIGMVQPRGEAAGPTLDELARSASQRTASGKTGPFAGLQAQDPIYSVGGAGEIARMGRTDDGRILVELRGISRFIIEEELVTTTPYRQARVRWQEATSGLSTDKKPFDKNQLISALEAFLAARSLSADIEAIASTPDATLVNTLASIVPLGVSEKQALLEAGGVSERARTLTSLLLMAGMEAGAQSNSAPQHTGH